MFEERQFFETDAQASIMRVESLCETCSIYEAENFSR